MSKREEERGDRVERLKEFLVSGIHVLNMNDSAVRTLMGLVAESKVPDDAVLPRWHGDPRNWSGINMSTTVNQATLSALIHKDVRSVRSALRTLEGLGYITRMPHKAGEKLVTKINASKILLNVEDAYQDFQHRMF